VLVDVAENVRNDEGRVEARLSKAPAKLKKPFVNKIIGHSEERLDQLLANPRNFRFHPDNQQQALAGSIDEVGFIRSLSVNKNSGAIIDGHARVAILMRSNVEKVMVEWLDLTDEEEAKAILMMDAIAEMAAKDKEKLDALMREVQSDDERVQQMIADMAEREGLEFGDNPLDDTYSRNIEAPIYTPKGEKPSVKDLFDTTHAIKLIFDIDASSLPDDEKEFLRIAAYRHTVLNFKRIAEYYSHSSDEVQRLMENSALVIIDFNRAIELGYVKLSKEIAEQYREDYPNA
jgi:hypothetical protein